MANSPYDDSDDPLRSPKFNRAIRQAEEKGIKYGFDFEGFYRKPKENAPRRMVGWDYEGEKVKPIRRNLGQNIGDFLLSADINVKISEFELDNDCECNNVDEGTCGYGFQTVTPSILTPEELDHFLGDDDCDGFIDEEFEHNRRIYGIERI